jgi:hypothetical protein
MMNTITNSAQQIQVAQRRTIPSSDEPTPSIASPPLSAERFGLAIGRIMHQFGIMELPVATATGTEVGTLRLSTASFMGHTMAAVAWERVEEGDHGGLGGRGCAGRDGPAVRAASAGATPQTCRRCRGGASGSAGNSARGQRDAMTPEESMAAWDKSARSEV